MKPGWVLALILLGFTLAISGAGWGVYKRQERAVLQAAQSELQAVADLKTSEISLWWEQYSEGARMVAETAVLRDSAKAFLNSPSNAVVRAQLLDWMGAYQRRHGFRRLVLLDSQANPRAAVPQNDAWVGVAGTRFAASALQNNRVVFSDLHLSEVSHRVNMDFLVPIVSSPATAQGAFIRHGCFLLEVDPADFLYPRLQAWPTSSATGETLLLRREGDRTLCLNELRHRANTALTLRAPMPRDLQPGGAKASPGKRGVIADVDYRGKHVLAAVRSLPNAPWILMAKRDQEEIDMPLRHEAWTIAAVVGVLILAMALAVGLVWRSREHRFSRAELAQRARAESALRESAERFRGFMAAAFEGICVHEQGRLIDANDQFLALFGYSREELIGSDVLSLVVPESRSLVAELFRSGKEGVHEVNALRKDGSIFPVEARGKASVWEGKAVRVAAVRDVIEKKRFEDALRKRIVALTQPLDQSADLDFTDLFDLEGIQKVQDAFASATGVASIITRPDGLPLTKPSNFRRFCGLIRQTEKGRLNCQASDAEIGRHDPSGPNIRPCLSCGLWDAGAGITVGGRHVANWLVGQVRDAEPDVAKAMECADAVGVDRNEYLQALREVPRMPREQFEQVARALFVLASELSLRAYQNSQQARFIADRQRAQEGQDRLLEELARKNRELESIIYVSSHDLRSPLVNIQGFSHRLETGCGELERLSAAPEEPEKIQAELRRVLGERVSPSLSFIQASVVKMDALLNGLLRLSRLGRASLRREKLDMTRLVEVAIKALAFQIQEAGARVEISPLPSCTGDAAQISQVLSNLIDNALKYRDPERSLVISIEGKTAEGEAIYSVQDNGLGIPQESQAKIWDVFQRLDPSSPVKGEGLGLAIVRRILDRHEGRVWMESGPGPGSRFLFALPAAAPGEGPAVLTIQL